MSELRVRIRRGRRTDFSAAMHLLAACDLPVPPPERATLRRFRALVADLGADFYVAEAEDQLVGLVHVTYARRLARLARAQLEMLIVAPPYRRRGVGRALLRFARRRAEKRACATLACDVAGNDAAAAAVLEAEGLAPSATSWSLSVPAGDSPGATQEARL